MNPRLQSLLQLILALRAIKCFEQPIRLLQIPSFAPNFPTLFWLTGCYLEQVVFSMPDNCVPTSEPPTFPSLCSQPARKSPIMLKVLTAGRMTTSLSLFLPKSCSLVLRRSCGDAHLSSLT